MPARVTSFHPEKLPCHRLYLGLDPGAGGGLAAVRGRRVWLSKTPLTDRDLWDLLTSLPALLPPGHPGRDEGVEFAALELVGGYVGGNPAPGSAMFNFGASYGALRMALTAAGIPFALARPQAWQRGLSIPPRKSGRKAESRTAWKNRLKAEAQRLFPGAAVTLHTADALLLAEYARRVREGKLNNAAR